MNILKNKMLLSLLCIIIFWILLPYGLISAGRALDDIFAIHFQFHICIIIGILILITALYISIKASLSYFIFTGSVPVIFDPPKRLIRDGIYANTRNPLYIGFLLYIAALGFLTFSFSTIIIVLPVFAIFLIVYIKFSEEKILYKRFGQKYLDYKQKTPFVWKSVPKDSPGMTLLYSFCYIAYKFILKFLIRIEIDGDENIPETGGALLVSNHVSYPDPFFIAHGCFRNLRFVTTAEIFRKRKNHIILTLLKSIPIKRFQKDPAGLKKMFKSLRCGHFVGYFPEGKRSWSGLPSPFPKGVARVLKMVKYPIIPVSMSGAYGFMPRWSDLWRRTNIHIRYHQPFKIDRSWSDEEICTRLNIIIHSTDPSFRQQISTTKGLNNGILNLLWRCPVCADFDGLFTVNENRLSCRSCNTHWLFTIDNELKVTEPADFDNPKRTFGEWYKVIESLPFPGFDDDSPYISQKSKKCFVSKGVYPDFELFDQGKITITRSGIHLFGDKGEYDWEFQDISRIGSEGNKKLQISIGKYQFQFFMPDDSVLKWETFCHYYKQNMEK